ncbi:hypothetical protein J6590_082300 [Homalodisca vitripennis]|nr:hypothetical protein J6590_082300 [Homalodisca vitripennis]
MRSSRSVGPLPSTPCPLLLDSCSALYAPLSFHISLTFAYKFSVIPCSRLILEYHHYQKFLKENDAADEFDAEETMLDRELYDNEINESLERFWEE